MTDLKAEIADLKASMDRMPRDTSTRPFYAALVACFEGIADELSRMPRNAIPDTFVEYQQMLRQQDTTLGAAGTEPKRVGWPKGKPRKPVDAPESAA